MTTATNIQIADHGTTGKNDNNKEALIMKIQSNIQSIFQGNAKVLAGMIIGGMVMAASILPTAASADSPEGSVSVSSGVAGIDSLYGNDSDLQFPSVRQVTAMGIDSLYGNDSDLQFPSVKQITGMSIESLYANDSDLQFPSVKQITGMSIESLVANDSDLQFPSVRQVTGIAALFLDDYDVKSHCVSKVAGIESLFLSDNDLQFPSVRQVNGMV